MFSRLAIAFLRAAAVAVVSGAWCAAAPVAPTDGRIFPRLTPSRAVLVVSVPRVQWARKAWGDVSGALPESPAGLADAALGEVARCLFSVEVALCSPDSGSSRADWILIGRVESPEVLPRALSRLEDVLKRSAASPLNPVSRAVESIGDAQLVILTDADASIGYFTHGPQGLCVLATNAELLRRTARLAARMPGAEAPPAHVDARMRRAADARAALVARPDACSSPDARFLLLGAGGRVTAGDAEFKAGEIRLGSVTHFARDSVSLMARLFSRVDSPSRAPGLRVAGAESLAVWGGRLLYGDSLQGYVDSMVEGVLSALPASNPSGLNEATARSRERLEYLRKWLREDNPLGALGPECFVVFESVEFGPSGRLPKVSCAVGVQVRDAAVVARGMARFEEVTARMARDRLAALSRVVSEALPPGVEVVATPPAGSSVGSGIVARYVSRAVPGSDAAMRVLDTGGRALPVRPAWAIAGGYLLVATTPESLVLASRRLVSGEGAAAQTGGAHTYLRIAPSKAPGETAAIVSALAVRAGFGDAASGRLDALVRRVSDVEATQTAYSDGAYTQCTVRIGNHD